MLEELNSVVNEYNEATKKLVTWAQSMLHTPFAETKNGESVLEYIAEIARASSLLNFKVIIMTMEELKLSIMDMEDSK